MDLFIILLIWEDQEIYVILPHTIVHLSVNFIFYLIFVSVICGAIERRFASFSHFIIGLSVCL